MILIQIPWNKGYYCQTFIFYFVPKISHYIEKDGTISHEKNKNAKFKFIRR